MSARGCENPSMKLLSESIVNSPLRPRVYAESRFVVTSARSEGLILLMSARQSLRNSKPSPSHFSMMECAASRSTKHWARLPMRERSSSLTLSSEAR